MRVFDTVSTNDLKLLAIKLNELKLKKDIKIEFVDKSPSYHPSGSTLSTEISVLYSYEYEKPIPKKKLEEQ